MRRRFSLDQWRSWFEEHESSGLSVAAFCRRIEVNQNSFYRWRRKLAVSACSNVSNVSQDLVPVEVLASETIRFEFPRGVVAELPNKAESIRPLLEVIFELESDS